MYSLPHSLYLMTTLCDGYSVLVGFPQGFVGIFGGVSGGFAAV